MMYFNFRTNLIIKICNNDVMMWPMMLASIVTIILPPHLHNVSNNDRAAGWLVNIRGTNWGSLCEVSAPSLEQGRQLDNWHIVNSQILINNHLTATSESARITRLKLSNQQSDEPPPSDFICQNFTDKFLSHWSSKNFLLTQNIWNLVNRRFVIFYLSPH